MKPSIVHVARECTGVVSSGGLGDVVQQLAVQCAAEGYPTTVVLPCYGGLARELVDRSTPASPSIPVPMPYGSDPSRTEPVVLRTIRHEGFELCLVDAPRFRGKTHPYVYTGEEAEAFRAPAPDGRTFCGTDRPFPGFAVRAGVGHFDYFAMNVLLQKAALELIRFRRPRRAVLHAHDAHCAALPLLARNTEYRDLSGTPLRHVVTSHNFGEHYRQRCHDRGFVLSVTGCDARSVDRCWVDGAFDPFAAAALYGDALTTVSEGYAWELMRAGASGTRADYGRELAGFSEFLARNGREVLGITNGINPAMKGPEALPQALRPENGAKGGFSWKKAAKAQWLARVRATVPEWGIPGEKVLGGLDRFRDGECLFISIGRLVEQKAPDVMIQAATEVLSYHRSTGLAVLGDADSPQLLQGLHRIVERFPGRLVVLQGFSDLLSRELYAAGDFLLVPSRAEPCGLVDFIAQLNGTVPVANQVGGLSKIVDGHTGIGYFALNDRENLRGLVDGMHRALALYRNGPELEAMRTNADRHVRSHYAWDAVFPKYRALYGD